jgi:2-polyprenyl-6-methoxyphenol hydroxylase-like FAD-dependent oxidoreductase
MNVLPRRVYNTMSLNILIIGAGCAGPAFAQLLQKADPKHKITVIERYSSLRTGGQQLDLKAEGIPIVGSMGLLGPLKEACVHETGMNFVDKHGTTLMQFGVNESAEHYGNLTNEYEIMRGDIVKVFYDGSLAERRKAEKNGDKSGSLTYKFGTTITRLEQSAKGASVTFANGQKMDYDLVVAADGQNSRTRRMAFGDDTTTDCFKPIEVHAAYFEIPRIESDDNAARIFMASGGRMTMVRTGDRPMTQVYFFIMKDKERHEKMKTVHKQSLEHQKEAWAEIFRDAGWQCKRFIEGLKTTDDFYAHEIAQVRMPQLHSGRVVLLGDAGYCPTPFTGMGTTLSLIGSYILAGELAKHGDDVDAALQGYHELMQRPLAKYQKLPRNNFYPSSDLGITVMNNVLWSLSSLKIDKMLLWISGKLPTRSKDGWEIGVYPNLGLDDKNL